MAKKNHREFRVRGVGAVLKNEIKNIVANIGSNESDFLKTKISDIVRAYPDHYKLPPKKD